MRHATPLTLLMFAALPLAAQDAPDPRAAQPERPTLATHAYAVAPGYAELETGGEWDHSGGSPDGLVFPVLLKLGLLPRLQLGLQTTLLQPPGSTLGLGDPSALLKLQLLEGAPLLGDFAVLGGLKLPVVSPLRGTETTDGTVLLISSHQFGAVGLDLNLGYTRRSGDGSAAPRNATVATIAAGWPLKGRLGFTAELFTLPHTSGPAGAPTAVALLGGPTFRLTPACVLDVGGIVKLAGDQPDALYAGLTWNLGRWRR